jgi:thiol:disulfide interchange protein/DsbC/DsbD-like thiol-disulfide interchange protein
VALRQTISKVWHTYWRNAGDAGQPTSIAWTLPAGWSAGDIVWAAPRKEVTGPLTDFGYEGEVLLPVPIKVPAGAKPGSVIPISAKVSYLVCKDICVPEDAVVQTSLKVGAATQPDAQWGGPVSAALAAAPKPAGLAAAWQWQGGRLTLAIAGEALKGKDVSDAFFFPYSGAVILHPAAQTIERGPEGLTLTLAPSDTVKASGPPAEIIGLITVTGGAYEVTAKAGPPPAGSGGLGVVAPKTAAGGKGTTGKAEGGGLNLITAVLSAFLGGLILNLMPCVFPVLSMKAASLAGHGGETTGARVQGLAFLAGCVATFLALAGVLLALKAAGNALGWGFQLQSAPVVAALALIMLLTALNLSGVFEIGASAQGVGQNLASRSGLIGAFFTGALAVVVAAPCTAPFMGPALGYAFVQPAPVALAVFLGLALGFAAPFTTLAFVPALLKRLPRPGAWMEGLKHVLAFPMYAAAAWLAWVLAQQSGALGLARLFGAGLLAAFAAWLYGVWQRGGIAGRTGARHMAVGAGAALALIAAFAVGLGDGAPAKLKSEPWSPARVAELRAQGHPILVNFTAAWCVTCQVNDKAAIETSGTARAFQETSAVYLVGDWTNRDAAIEAALAEHGRAGVPLYLVYPADGGEPKVLPQILTEGMVTRALKAAAGS